MYAFEPVPQWLRAVLREQNELIPLFATLVSLWLAKWRNWQNWQKLRNATGLRKWILTMNPGYHTDHPSNTMTQGCIWSFFVSRCCLNLWQIRTWAASTCHYYSVMQLGKSITDHSGGMKKSGRTSLEYKGRRWTRWTLPTLSACSELILSSQLKKSKCEGWTLAWSWLWFLLGDGLIDLIVTTLKWGRMALTTQVSVPSECTCCSRVGSAKPHREQRTWSQLNLDLACTCVNRTHCKLTSWE